MLFLFSLVDTDQMVSDYKLELHVVSQLQKREMLCYRRLSLPVSRVRNFAFRHAHLQL